VARHPGGIPPLSRHEDLQQPSTFAQSPTGIGLWLNPIKFTSLARNTPTQYMFHHSYQARVLALAALFACLTPSHAGVVVTFRQIGSDVVASTSGSITTPGGLNAGIATEETYSANPFSLLYLNGNFKAVFFFATNFQSGLSGAPNTASGDHFGYNGTDLYVADHVNVNSEYSPNTTWTWTNRTLAGIGLGSLSSTPQVVWAGNWGGAGNTISFAAIPEPCSGLLLVGSLACGILRRKRRAI
jgi:hypothetical protein